MVSHCKIDGCDTESYVGWPALGLCSEHLKDQDQFVQSNPEIVSELERLVDSRKRLSVLYQQAQNRWYEDHKVVDELH